MKPTLVVGLGNPLMGDEGIGWHVVDRLSGDSRLPGDTDLLWAGTDLLRWTDQMEGRRRIVLVDAMLGASEVGSITVFGDGDGLLGLEDRQEHVHNLSAIQAVRLLRMLSPSLATVRFTLMAIAIDSACMKLGLSPVLAATMPHILDRVLGELACRLSC